MANKIKSISECGVQPTFSFEVGRGHPCISGKKVTEIIHVGDERERIYHIFNDDGLYAEMIDVPVVVVYDQSEEN